MLHGREPVELWRPKPHGPLLVQKLRMFLQQNSKPSFFIDVELTLMHVGLSKTTYLAHKEQYYYSFKANVCMFRLYLGLFCP